MHLARIGCNRLARRPVFTDSVSSLIKVDSTSSIEDQFGKETIERSLSKTNRLERINRRIKVHIMPKQWNIYTLKFWFCKNSNQLSSIKPVSYFCASITFTS